MTDWPTVFEPTKPGDDWDYCPDCRQPTGETLYWVDGQWVCANCRWEDL